MAVTAASFLERFPHFTAAGNTLIEAELTQARLHVNAKLWGEQTDDGVMQLTAHRIAKNPGGQFARLINKDGSTNYLAEFERMEKRLLVGDRVW